MRGLCDLVACAALWAGLALPWAVGQWGLQVVRGADIPWVLAATLLALIGLALPHAQRLGLVSVPLPAVRMVSSVTAAIYLLMAGFYVVYDILPGGQQGIGIGLTVGASGVVLALGPRSRLVPFFAMALAVLATFAAPIIFVVTQPWHTSVVLTSVASALVVALMLSSTLWQWWRHQRLSAAVASLAWGLNLMLAAMVVGPASSLPWLQSVRGPELGLILLPVVAACAVPGILGQLGHLGQSGQVGQSRQVRRIGAQVWLAAVRQMLALSSAVGAYMAVTGIMGLIYTGDQAGNRFLAYLTVTICGALIACISLFTWSTARQDSDGFQGADARPGVDARQGRGGGQGLAAGHIQPSVKASAAGTALVIAGLGLVMALASGGWTVAITPMLVLLVFVFPASILCMLAGPRWLGILTGSFEGLARPEGPERSGAQARPVLTGSGLGTPGPGSSVPQRPGPGRAGSGVPGPSAQGPSAQASPAPAAATSGPEVHGPVQEMPHGIAHITGTIPHHPQSAGPHGSDPHSLAPHGIGPHGPAPHSTSPRSSADPHQSHPLSADSPHRPDHASPADASPATSAAGQVLPPTGAMNTAGLPLHGPQWTPHMALDPNTPLTTLAQIASQAPHLRPQVAANPAAYPALLQWLAALGDPDVDAALRQRSTY